MTAEDIEQHLHSLDDGWVDWSETTARIVSGVGQVPVTGIAVGWMS